MTEQHEPFYSSPNTKLNRVCASVHGHEGISTDPIKAASPLSQTDVGIDVRPGFHRKNYEKYRGGDAIPVNSTDIMLACRNSYETVGIIKSVVDLMTELAIEGLELVSEDPSTENFYHNWSKRVNLKDRAERFANYLLIEGNVTVRRKMGKLNSSQVRALKRKKTLGGPETAEIEPGLIPLQYLFYDPSTVELIGKELAVFIGKKEYGLKITHNILTRLVGVSPTNRAKLINQLPEEMRRLFHSDQKTKLIDGIIVPIPMNRFYVAHNKKKDSDIWAKSFIYSILHDVIYNEKLRLAKLSALDGWHNSVRVWKLGDHKLEILPDVAAFSKLASILQHHPGGNMDIIWDSMIQMEPFYPPIEKLGGFEENFEAMMLGLGVPRTMVGGSESSGLTNMFIGLRNMMKRIDGIRRELAKWIEQEVLIISDNLGLRVQPQIKFAISNLFDQQSYFKLVVDLYDRHLISDRSVLDKIGEFYEIERVRVKSETDLRDSGTLAADRNPLEQPVIPPENKKHAVDLQNLTHKQSKETAKMSKDDGGGGPPNNLKIKPKKTNGRPPGSKDTKTRSRRFRAKAELVILADKIQDKLDKILDPNYLGYNKIENKRQLTSSQKTELDDLKLLLLSCIDSLDFESGDLDSIIAKSDTDRTEEFTSLYEDQVSGLEGLSCGQIKTLRSNVFAEINVNVE